jgi:hypothetical protein
MIAHLANIHCRGSSPSRHPSLNPCSHADPTIQCLSWRRSATEPSRDHPEKRIVQDVRMHFQNSLSFSWTVPQSFRILGFRMTSCTASFPNGFLKCNGGVRSIPRRVLNDTRIFTKGYSNCVETEMFWKIILPHCRHWLISLHGVPVQIEIEIHLREREKLWRKL